MNEELKVLEIVTQRLDKANIPYMITGSIALNYYATPRMTRDLDIVIELKQPDVTTLLNLFQTDFYIDEDMILTAINDHGMFNIIHNEWVFKVDFIVRKHSEYHQSEFDRRKRVKLKNFEFWIVSPEDLILSKLQWAKDSMSDLQLRDVNNLLKSVEDLNIDLIEKWVQKLNLEILYQKTQS